MKRKSVKQCSTRRRKDYKAPMIIVLDGPDGVGKDTVEREIHKLTNYKHVIINRFLASNYVYSKYFRREDFEWNCTEYLKLDAIFSKLKKHIYVAFLTASTDELKQRIKGRDDVRMCNKWRDIFPIFMEYLEKSKLRWNWIDTNNFDPKRVAQVIVNLAEGE